MRPQSLAVLSQFGLLELIANSPATYVALATGLAADLRRRDTADATGTITIGFVSVKKNAKVSGIEILAA